MVVAAAAAAAARAVASAATSATFKNSDYPSSSSSSRLVDSVMSIFVLPKFQGSNRISSYCSFSEQSPVQVFEKYENNNSSSVVTMSKTLFCKSYASSSLQFWFVLLILLTFLGYKRVYAKSPTELQQKQSHSATAVAFHQGKNNRTRKSATSLDFRAIVQAKWDEFRTQKTERTAQMKQQLSSLKIPPSPFRILLPEEEDDLFFATSKFDESAATTEEPWIVDSDDSEDDEVNANKSPSSFDGITHFCFLVHGHRGHSRDLSYVQAVMRRCHKQSVSTATAAVSTNSKSTLQQPQPLQQRLIVHSVTCNEKKTDDGVRAGGERLVDEMLHVMRNAMSSCKSATTSDSTGSSECLPLQRVTISLWGNSLGGLYARYAIAALAERCRQSCRFDYDDINDDGDDSTMILDDAYALRFNVFCTTATPHLGVSGHTFLSLPRTAEIGVATMMGETGKDLFRTNTLLWQMAVERQYTQALSHFRKRICYANAYGTDFPVPASTAAFLSSSSTYPHHFANSTELSTVNDEDGTNPSDDAVTARNNPPKRQHSDSSSLVIATLHTTPSAMALPPPPPGRDAFGRSSRNRSTSRSLSTTSQDVSSSEHGGSSESTDEFSTRSTHVESRPDADGDTNDVDLDDMEDDNENDNVNGSTLDEELAQMSMSLDALGWKKVFVDMRKEVPRIAIPKSMIPSVRLTTSTRAMPTEATVKDDTPSNKDGASSFETTSTDSSSNSSDEDGHESMSSVLSNSRPKATVDAAESSSSSLLSSLLGPVSTTGTQPLPAVVVESMESLRVKGTVVSSKDVAAAVTTPSSLSSFWPSTTEDDEHLALHWPIGHNMIVAFSRSRWSTYMNRAGRPVVDALAQEIVTDIMSVDGSTSVRRATTMLPQQRRLKEYHAPK